MNNQEEDIVSGKYDNIHAIMDFTEVLKNEPEKAYDFIVYNSYRFTKEGFLDIVKELLQSIKHHVSGSFYGDLYANILGDVQIELDENYDKAYQEYHKWLEEINEGIKNE